MKENGLSGAYKLGSCVCIMNIARNLITLTLSQAKNILFSYYLLL
jgi:hypothetical protein